jgi:tRNA(Ile)-lysidine synthetase-like protein
MESILLHLTRGGGKDAMQTLPPWNGSRFLPLMFLKDDEILSLYRIAEDKFPIFPDSSNSDAKYKRNRIRAGIIPLLIEENQNFYKLYWNFHLWESNELLMILQDEKNLGHHLTPDFKKSKSVPRQNASYFKIPEESLRVLNTNDKKRLFDFYLSLLDHPPLYRAPFLEFISQSSKGRAQIETEGYILFKDSRGPLYILRKDSPLFLSPEISVYENLICIKWNREERKFENQNDELSVSSRQKGQIIQTIYGHKDVSKLMREYKIPPVIRDQIPILYKKNLPFKILLSMFDPSLPDIPKSKTIL